MLTNRQMTNDIKLEDYPVQSFDRLRYSDADRLGHVNNAVFSTLLETGRVDILYDPAAPLAEPGTAFVIARLVLDFRSEITWPGTIRIGTRVASIGRSSVRFEQAIFQDDRCAATAETIIVLMDEETRRSKPLPQATIEKLSSFMKPSGVPPEG
jgi:acyl-CoA thioester hydrolase